MGRNVQNICVGVVKGYTVKLRCRKLRYYAQFTPQGMHEPKVYGIYDATTLDDAIDVYTCA